MCVFCEIGSGRAPAHVVFADEEFLGFLDVRPLFPGHVLVVPRTHYATLLDVPGEVLGPLTARVQRTAAGVQSAMAAQGTFVAMNNVVSQSVPHLHVHVVPRTKGDGLRGFFWPRTRYASDEEAGATATAIAAAIAAAVPPD